MNDILQQFGAKFQNASLDVISGGLINQTWKVTAEGERFVLQRINDQVFKEPQRIANNIRLLADHLKEIDSDYFLVSPIKTLDNQELAYKFGQGYFRLTSFVKKSKTIQVVETAEQAYEAALQFGKFAAVFSEFDVQRLQTTIPHFHDLTARYKQFEESLVHGNPKRIATCAEEIRQLKSQSRLVEEYERKRKDPNFKLRVTHHDTKISNVLFDSNDKGICVIDLDTVMPGYFFSDVGDMMRTYLSPVNEEVGDFSLIEVRPDFYRAIVSGYSEAMGSELAETEMQSFSFAGKFLMYMQSLRFLTDYFNDDRYYQSTYAGQNLVRARNQLHLLFAFDRTVGQIKL